MTTKAEFNAEEWEQIAEGPALAGLIVITAQRGGTIRETMAMAKAYTAAQKDHASGDLVGEIVSVRAEARPEAVLQQGGPAHPGARQDHARRSGWSRRATPDELVDYREFILNRRQPRRRARQVRRLPRHRRRAGHRQGAGDHRHHRRARRRAAAGPGERVGVGAAGLIRPRGACPAYFFGLNSTLVVSVAL